MGFGRGLGVYWCTCKEGQLGTQRTQPKKYVRYCSLVNTEHLPVYLGFAKCTHSAAARAIGLDRVASYERALTETGDESSAQIFIYLC